MKEGCAHDAFCIARCRTLHKICSLLKVRCCEYTTTKLSIMLIFRY